MRVGRFLRYFATYRWELCLVIGIPFAEWVVRVFSGPLVGALVDAVERDLGLLGSSLLFTTGGNLSAGLLGLLLLSVSYLRVRRLDRAFLPSLWRYSIVVAVIGVVVAIAAIVVTIAFVHPAESRTLGSARVAGVSLIGGFATFIALLWFARQLSRVGITHAFFLVGFTSLSAGNTLQGTAIDAISVVRFAVLLPLVSMVVGLIVAVIKVWLLGNFDRRGERFRKQAIIIVVVAGVLTPFVWVAVDSLHGYMDGLAVAIDIVVNLVSLLVVFGSVYLVRVRQPKTEIVESHT